MSKTLLKIVQDILSSMDSDEVNSINDTVEAQQVATIVANCFDEIIEQADLPEMKSLFNVTASTDPTQPVVMTVPSNVAKIEWVKYNSYTSDDTRTRFLDVKYRPLQEFLMSMYELDSTEDTVESLTKTVNGSSVTFMYRNDRAPMYYTTYDDNTLIFDSYDSEIEATLQSSKTLAFGKIFPTFSMTDTYVPPLDQTQMSLLFNESKATAWAELKQTTHQKAERKAKSQWISLQRTQDRVKQTTAYDYTPNYGRK